MPSHALQLWGSQRCSALDEIATAHRAVGGTGPGRRSATRHINQAYAVLLSSHFQGFCRDLHSEAVTHLIGTVRPVSLQPIFQLRMLEGRKLDRGNPNPGNLGADFGRFGLVLWPEIRKTDSRNRRRQELLMELTDWRNAIAHQDFASSRIVRSGSLQLSQVRRWRSACDHLARAMDVVLERHLHSLTGAAPW